MNSKLHVGAVYLYQDEWKISLSCNDCGMESDKLDSFLLHALEHRLHVKPENIVMLIDQLMNSVEEENGEEMDHAAEHNGNDFSDDPFTEDDMIMNDLMENSNNSLDAPIQEEEPHSADREPIKTANAYKCCLCPTFFKSYSSCRTHIQTHTTESQHQCDICGVSFLGLRSLRAHRKCHVHECEHCSKKFQTATELKSHTLKVHLNRRSRPTCPICGQYFINSELLAIHLKEHHGQRDCVCPKCHKTFGTIDELTEHMLEHKEPSEQEEDSQNADVTSPAPCDSENEEDNVPVKHIVNGEKLETVLVVDDGLNAIKIELLPEDGEDLTNYDDMPIEDDRLCADDFEPIKTKNGYKCALCSKVFKRYSYCRTHLLIHSNRSRYKCDICSASFLGSSSLRTHRQRHLGIKPYPCEHCEKAFHTASELKSHTRNIHLTRRPNACPICGQYFKIAENLEIHLKNHRDERAWVCSNCDETFLTNGALSDHAVKVHGARVYRCTMCQLSFNDKEKFREHCRIHNDTPEVDIEITEEDGLDAQSTKFVAKALSMPNEPNLVKTIDGFQCGQCKKIFKRSSQCRLHIRTHTNYRPHSCEICGASFKDKSNLNVHLNRHLGVKPFECKDCDKSFITSTELKLHMRVHTGIRPHVCTECGHSFSIRQQLELHLRRHRNERPFVCTHCGRAYFSMSDLKEHELLHLEEPQFKCTVCEKAFGRKKTLSEHMRLHDTEKRYDCKICGMRFAQYTGRYLHMKKMHPSQ